MYRPTTRPRDKAAAIAIALAVQAGMVLAFLGLGDFAATPRDDDQTTLINILPDPPPPPPVIEEAPKPRPKEAEGKAAPPNKKSTATEVVKPKPRVELPVKDPVVAAPIRNSGDEATNGAATPGPGTGAGGVGNGTGSGGSGNGAGGGGGGGRVRLVKGITNRDYPGAVQVRWPNGGAIFTRVRVEPDGRASSCDVVRSFGDSTADMLTCSLLLKKGRFKPATDASGRPVAAWFGYVQRHTGRFDN